MVLLAVVCVGLLGLSAISLRGSTQAEAQAAAQANARLALMIAIGELQKQLGPDQRVSANGAILSDSQVRHPHWTGVWNSWKAGPGEASQHRTIAGVADQMAPTYQANRADQFRAWLLSLNPGESENLDSAGSLNLTGQRMPDGSAAAVQLVGEGSLGKPAQGGTAASEYVSARLLSVESNAGAVLRGRYGWWVGDESQKARLMDDSYITDADNSLAGRLSRQQAPGSMGTRTIPGFENITDDGQLAGLPSLLTVSLIDGTTGQAKRNFHHATPFSYHVLADVREGGLKRDLSTLLERPITLSETGDEFMLYKFNDSERVPIQDLAAYYQLHRPSIGDANEGNLGVQYSSSSLRGGIQIPTPDYGGSNEKEKFHRQYTSIYRSPVPIKLQLLLGMVARARPRSDINSEYPDTHELFLTTTLSMTLWNPTNLPMVMDNRERRFQRLRWNALPLLFKWNKNGGQFEQSVPLRWLLGAGNNHICELDISRGEPLRFEPGEVKVLSIPMASIPGRHDLIDFQRWDNESRDYQNLVPNWNPAGFLTLSRSAANNFLRSNGTIRYDAKFPPHILNGRLLFSADDRIQLQITAIRASTIDSDRPDAFYHYGWNWWIEPINSVLEAPVQVTEDGKGYYGGGYTPEVGTTHVVQQEIPVVPPMSIASLSHAHLGGISLADSVPNQIWQIELEPTPLAVGKDGLFPHTLQAVGNSYAYPQLPADAAFDDGFQRTFNSADGARSVVFADHSYLANKALWDEFFFSSITPHRAIHPRPRRGGAR